MRRKRLAAIVLGGLVVAGGLALAGRPPEALDAEQRAQALELSYLIRKTDSLSGQLVERRSHLRKRVRALYKMSQGGYLRLLLGSDGPADLFQRRDAANRILTRDVRELEAVRAELEELAGLRERLRDGQRRAAELAVEARETSPTGLGKKDAFMNPVGGEVRKRFGPERDPESGLEFTRDGVLLASRPGESVSSPAAGAVRFVGELPGLGTSIVIDHGEGWLTVLARLGETTVRPGAHVPRGFKVGESASYAIEMQLVQDGAWIDPAPWVERHKASPARSDEASGDAEDKDGEKKDADKKDADKAGAGKGDEKASASQPPPAGE